MELDGISKACKLKVMMKRPVTSTTAIEEMNSIGVSFFFSGFSGAAFFSICSFTNKSLAKVGASVAQILARSFTGHSVDALLKSAHDYSNQSRCVFQSPSSSHGHSRRPFHWYRDSQRIRWLIARCPAGLLGSIRSHAARHRQQGSTPTWQITTALAASPLRP